MSTYLPAFGLILTIITGMLSLYQFGKNRKSPGLFFALCAIALIVGTIYVGGLSSPTTSSNVDAQSSSIPPSSSYVQLQHSYSGTASGYADGTITFTLISEDQQGNLTMNTTFQQLSGAQKIASYSCQGSVTLDRHLNLQCSNISDPTYVLTIQGYVYSDGHMEGTEVATNTNDTSYNHPYSWKAY